MQRRKLGRIDLHVSELCLGTLNFGWHAGEATAFELLDRFHRAGGNFIQSCALGADDAFGPGATGVSESFVGRWLKTRAIPRHEVVLASRHSVVSTGTPGELFRVAAGIRRACEDSLRRLNVRYLDLLVFEWREGMPMEETLVAAETLVRAGMVRHVAASTFPTWRVMEWLAHSLRRNLCRFEMMQDEFSLVSNAQVNSEAFALCRAHHLGFVARAPLAGGFLAERYAALPAPHSGRARHLRARYANPLARAALAELRAVAEARGVPPAVVAIAWVLAQPGVSAALVGPNSVTQLEGLLGATELDLCTSEVQRLRWRWQVSVPEPADDELAGLPAEGANAVDEATSLDEVTGGNVHT